jgi:hypothetical protein
VDGSLRDTSLSLSLSHPLPLSLKSAISRYSGSSQGPLTPTELYGLAFYTPLAVLDNSDMLTAANHDDTSYGLDESSSDSDEDSGYDTFGMVRNGGLPWARELLDSKRNYGMLALPLSMYRTTQQVRKLRSSIVKRRKAGNAQDASQPWTMHHTAGTVLGDLPAEILTMILKDQCLSVNDWYWLCCVKPLHDVAIGLLCEKVNCRGEKAAQLASTLLKFPHLAPSVKVLYYEKGSVLWSRELSCQDIDYY